MKKHPMLKYLKEEGPAGPRLPLIMCPGCGAGQVLNYALHAVDTLLQEDALRKEDFVFISGVGCSSRLASHYLNFDSGWTLHGRALAVATGAQLANPRLKIVVFTGDGDAAAIGGNHNMKKITVPLKKSAAEPAAGKIPVGEFRDIDKPDWIERYQNIMDRLSE